MIQGTLSIWLIARKSDKDTWVEFEMDFAKLELNVLFLLLGLRS